MFRFRVKTSMFWLMAALPAAAQFRGGIQGTVTDQTGGAVPGVSITCTSTETQRKVDSTSDEGGVYHCLQLGPGTYTVQATQAGFKATSSVITVNAEALQKADITLEPGQVNQVVTVTADSSPSIETTNGDVTRAITTEEIRDLPQVGRDPYELLRLTPGIFGDGARAGGAGISVAFPNSGRTANGGASAAGPGGSNASLFQTENQVPISADGQRITANNYLLDGVSVNSLQWGGAAVITPNQESIKEIRVNANAYSAEYGRNSGAQIETVSQNGTGQFHGSAVFLFQDPNFNAYNKVAPAFLGIPVSRVDNNFRNYAGSIGGPILKDRLFFFFSLEGIHEHSTSFSPQYVETPQYDQAVLSLRPNSIAAKIVGTTGSQPRIVNTLPVSACPAALLPNCTVVAGGFDLGSIGGVGGSNGRPGTYFDGNSFGGGLDGVADLEYADIASPTFLTGHQFNGRLDWTRNNDLVAGSTYVTNSNQTGTGNPLGRPNGDQVSTPLNADVTAIWTHTFNGTTLNEARGNFTRFSFNQLANAGPTNYGIPEIDIQPPGINQIQYGVSRGDSSPGVFTQNTYEFRDAFSKVLGNHAFKLGLEVRREQDNNNLAGGARPVYSFQNFWNFANDAPIFEGVEANPATGGPPLTQHYFRTHVYSLYLQDDWKVASNLTLNLGVRWEYFSPFTEKTGNLYDWIPGPGFGNLTQSTIQQVKQLSNANTNNVGPRFGFAYNPKPWIVARGGFGLLYNRVEDSLLALTRQDSPLSEQFGFCCALSTNPTDNGQVVYGLGSSNSIYSYPFNPATATGINPATNTPNGEAVQVYAVPRHFPTPYAFIYSFETDFSFARDYVLTVGYQGSADHHLIHLVDQKFLYPSAGLGATNFTDIFNIAPDANSNYSALNATFSRRLSKGIQFQDNFRWAKSLDMVSYEGPGGGTNPTYPQNFQSEYGPSDFDVKFSDTLSALYELPFFRSQRGLAGKVLGGWRVNTIFTFHTGFPWTPKSTAQAEETPGGATLSPVRPYDYLCSNGNGPCALAGESNSAFTRPNGNFPGGGANYFLFTYPTGFTTLPPGIGRNSFRGPWYKDVDFSVDKVVKMANRVLGEATQLDLRLNIFNAFNQQNFAPFSFNDTSTIVNDPHFGQPLNELAGRSVELQARFSF